MDRMSEADRAAFRERGRTLLGLLVAHLDAPDPARRRRPLAEASILADRVTAASSRRSARR